MAEFKEFNELKDIANDFRKTLKNRTYLSLFAYNRVGKTRLSMEFKDIGKKGEIRDTLYFNAYTEDLFTWNNDLDGDINRYLNIHPKSNFCDKFKHPDVIEKVRYRTRRNLKRYANFTPYIRPSTNKIIFARGRGVARVKNIKISRGEQNIFIWCLFLAIVELVLDGNAEYRHIKYIYIDDPISSLDDSSVIAVACDLVNLLKKKNKEQLKKKETNATIKITKTVISSHHGLFFNVLCNELKDKQTPLSKYFLTKDENPEKYYIRNVAKNEFFPYHIAMMSELEKATQTRELYTYHFNILRSILEKTATFFGLEHFSKCIHNNKEIQTRALQIFSHGNYPFYEPKHMQEGQKDLFIEIFKKFVKHYKFNFK